MGTSIYLDIPEERKTVELLYDYYEYKAQKEAQINGEDPFIVEDHNVYCRKLSRLNQKNELWISEKLSSTICEGLDMGSIYNLFGINDHDAVNGSILTDDEIRELIEILRKGEKNLNEIQSIPDWELTLEKNQIALCEFALNEDLGVGLSI